MSDVSVSVHAPGSTIVMNRPQSGNALSRSLVQSLEQAFDDLHQEKRVRYVILTGSGSHFCTGMDLKELHKIREQETTDSLHAMYEDWERIAELLQKMLRFPKPIIAAVDGDALGAGLALALAADLVVGTDRARFGAPAQLHGLISGLVAPLAAFRLGGSIAARLILTGKPISVGLAHSWGLVTQETSSDQVWVAAEILGQSCSAGPSEAMQLTKRLLNESIGETLSSHLTIGAGMGATACSTESAAEGLRAFTEKRPPVWSK